MRIIDNISCLTISCILLLTSSSAFGANEGGRVITVAVPDGGHAVAARVDSEGAIHLLFDTKDGPKYARSTDGGASFQAPLAIVGRDALRPGLEYHGWDLAVGEGGRVHVAMGTNAWKLKLPREEWGFYYSSLAPRAASFSPVRNINRKPSEGFSLAADERGNVAACWLSGKLCANLSHDGGQTFSRAVEIDPQCDPCDCCTTSCTFCTDGRLAVLYREETGNERDMYLLLWDYEEGRSVRRRISSTLWKIDACPMTYYSVTRRGDGFVAAWPTKGQVYFTRLDRWGKLLPPPEIKVPGSTGMRTGLVALSASDGATLVAWKEKDEVRWQLYDADARPVGPPGAAKSGGKGVAGVETGDGKFVLFQ